MMRLLLVLRVPRLETAAIAAATIRAAAATHRVAAAAHIQHAAAAIKMAIAIVKCLRANGVLAERLLICLALFAPIWSRIFAINKNEAIAG